MLTGKTFKYINTDYTGFTRMAEEYAPRVIVSAKTGLATKAVSDSADVERDRRQAVPERIARRKRIIQAVMKAKLANSIENQNAQAALLMINNKRLNRVPLSQDELLMEQRAMVKMDRIAALNIRCEKMIAAVEANTPCDPQKGEVDGDGGTWDTDDRTPDV